MQSDQLANLLHNGSAVLTSIVKRIDTAAISWSLEALIGSDNPSLTSLIVSPRWWNVSRSSTLERRLLGSVSGSSPAAKAEFDAATHIQACNDTGSC